MPDLSRASALLLLTIAACSPPAVEQPLVELLPPVGAAGSLAPHLSTTAAGHAVLSWIEPADNGNAVRLSVLEGNAWTTPLTIASSENMMVNWADFPSVTPVSDTLWAAHWLRKLPAGGYAYEIVVSLSTDGGQTWTEPQLLHDDGTDSEHGFVSLYPAGESVGAVWLDGRNTVDGGSMTLRSAIIGSSGEISESQVIDERVCDCCQTDVAVGPGGPVAVYRDRSADEIRDIRAARLVDGSWRAGESVADDGWRINGCPVNGPSIASNRDALAVAWFTAADEDSQVKFAWSGDDPGSFDDAIAIDADRPVGRVDVELVEDGSAIVSWLRAADDGNGEICLRTVSPGGEPGPVHVVARTGVNRASGYPQMSRDGADVVLAWTDASAEQSKVVTARIRTASLFGTGSAD